MGDTNTLSNQVVLKQLIRGIIIEGQLCPLDCPALERLGNFRIAMICGNGQTLAPDTAAVFANLGQDLPLFLELEKDSRRLILAVSAPVALQSWEDAGLDLGCSIGISSVHSDPRLLRVALEQARQATVKHLYEAGTLHYSTLEYLNVVSHRLSRRRLLRPLCSIQTSFV